MARPVALPVTVFGHLTTSVSHRFSPVYGHQGIDTWVSLRLWHLAYYVLFFIHWETRQVHIAGVTPHPNEAWMRHIARNVTMEEWGGLKPGQYLIHDHTREKDPAGVPGVNFRGGLGHRHHAIVEPIRSIAGAEPRCTAPVIGRAAEGTVDAAGGQRGVDGTHGIGTAGGRRLQRKRSR